MFKGVIDDVAGERGEGFFWGVTLRVSDAMFGDVPNKFVRVRRAVGVGTRPFESC